MAKSNKHNTENVQVSETLLWTLRNNLTVIEQLGELSCWSSVAGNGLVMAASDIARELLKDVEKITDQLAERNRKKAKA